MSIKTWILQVAVLVFGTQALATTEPFIDDIDLRSLEFPLRTARWDHSAEVWWTFVAGSQQNNYFLLKEATSFKQDRHTVETSLQYMTSSQNKIKSYEITDISGKYVYSFSKRLGIFYGYNIHRDSAGGIRVAQNHDIGTRYFVPLSPKTYILTETGYRYAIEEEKFHYPVGRSKLRAYVEVSHTISSSSEIKFWAEYLPHLGVRNDYIINFEPSITVSVAANLYVKFWTPFYFRSKLTYNGEKYLDRYGYLSLKTKF